MLKRIPALFITLCIFFSIATAQAAQGPVLAVTGTVKQPLFLTWTDLASFQSITVGQAQFDSNGHFLGELYYQAVPLRTLVTFAGIEKDFDSRFTKPIDMGIVVKDVSGNRAVFSWGEVLQRDPARIVVAIASLPGGLKNPKLEGALEHPVPATSLPWLLVAQDIIADRSLKQIAHIDVVNVTERMSLSKKLGDSKTVEITGAVRETVTIKKLSQFPEAEVTVKRRHRHDDQSVMARYSGASLRTLVERAEVTADTNSIVLVWSPDGYRSLVSYGELFLNQSGNRMLIADRLDGTKPQDGGPFMFICPDDPTPARWVNAISQIEIVQLNPDPKLYVVGTGCGDSDLISIEALSCLGGVDALIAPEDLYQRYARYIGNKPILIDQKECNERFVAKNHPELSLEAVKEYAETARDKVGEEVKEALKRGQSVALLEYGDPTLYSTRGWRWMFDYLDEADIEVVPGISSFNASNALIAKDGCCEGGLVIAGPWTIEKNEPLIKAAAEHGETLVLFMGLMEPETYLPTLKKYYEEKTPVAISYNAGIGQDEKVVKTTLHKLQEVVTREEEKFLGIIYIGPCMR